MLAGAACGLALWRLRKSPTPRSAPIGVLTIACFFAAGNVLLVVSVLEQRSHDIEPDIARMRQALPPGERLLSFGWVHPRFAYHFGGPIERGPWPGEPVREEVRYFCVDMAEGRRPQLPFAWEEVGVVCCDRYRRARPREYVLVGKRVGD